MFQYLKYLKLALKITPCLIEGYKSYEEAAEDEDITAKEWSKIIERFIKCVLSKIDTSDRDEVIITTLFNSPKYKIKLD